MIDAVSRVYDIDPLPPQVYESKSTEGIDIDDYAIEVLTDHEEAEDVYE